MPAPAAAPTRLRVLHVIQNLHYGGMERVLHSIARQLPALGFEMHIATLDSLGRFAQGLDLHAKLHEVGGLPRSSLLRPRKLVALMKAVGPDIVHSHSGVWLKAARAAHLARIPLVVHTEHGRPDPVPLLDRWSDALAARWTDGVIAVSEPLAGLLRAQVLPSATPLSVIPNGIAVPTPLGHDERAAFRSALGIAPSCPVIGSVGRLEPVKNYQLAIHALAELPPPLDQAAGPFLVLVGDGSERPRLEAIAQALGVADRVRFLGWRDDADRLCGAFDIFTLTSTSEGTSISLLEAMCMRVCPVVTDVGGNRDVLGPELEALLVPSGEAASLARVWNDLLGDPSRRRRLATQAHARASTQFSIERMVAALSVLYRTHPRGQR